MVAQSDAGIDKSLALERKIESRKRNFSLDLENLIVSISLSTLDFSLESETLVNACNKVDGDGDAALGQDQRLERGDARFCC